MPTFRVTLSTGQAHDVETTPETVVSFTTLTRDGRGHEQRNIQSWADVAGIEDASGLKPLKPAPEPVEEVSADDTPSGEAPTEAGEPEAEAEVPAVVEDPKPPRRKRRS